MLIEQLADTRPEDQRLDASASRSWMVIQAMKPSGTRLMSATRRCKDDDPEACGMPPRSKPVPLAGDYHLPGGGAGNKRICCRARKADCL